MRLAVEVTTCTSERAGIGYYTEHLVDALIETRGAGDDVVLLSNRAPAPELAERWGRWLRVAQSPVRAIWMQTVLPRLLSENDVDLLVCPNYVVPLASPCPTIVVVHDVALARMPELFTVRKRLMRPLLAHSIAAASAVATVSEASRRDIGVWFGIDASRVSLLPGAAHPSCGPVPEEAVGRVRARFGLGRPYLLTVGTLEPRKNLRTLLDAFDRLGGAARGLDLVVVGGRGWRDRDLLRALRARASDGHVRWLGYVAERELAALYAGAKVFVYPSRLEGFGLPVVEAMACGTPVVAADVPALREVAGDAATFVPPGDAAALAAAVSRMLSEPALAEGTRARGLVRARAFSWTRTAEAAWTLARETGAARVRPDGRASKDPLGSPPATLDRRDWSVLASVAYADLFEAPLPRAEIGRACIGSALETADLPGAVAGLRPHVKLHETGDLALAGRDALVARRQAGIEETKALLERRSRLLSALASLPFVRMLAFSGGTAHQNPGAKSDIDLFVVAAGGHAYVAYALLVAATKLTGTRDVVCPNYLVDERELGIAYHHDLFTAHQLVSIRPASGLETYRAFCEANAAWVQEFFPGFQPREVEATTGSPGIQRALERLLSPAASMLEPVVRFAWRAHVRRRAGRFPRPDLVLGDGILKLHLGDYRRSVLDRFASRLDALRAELGAVPTAGTGTNGSP